MQDPKQAISDFVDWANGKLNAIKQTFTGLGELISAKSEQKQAEQLNADVHAKMEQSKANGTRYVDLGNGSSWVTNVNDPEYQQYLKEHGYTDSTVPQLAEGAVLEPNKPFLAVVGDQTQGTNVEAPLETIKQALREELEQIVVNVLVSIQNDPDRMYDAFVERSWTERKRTNTVQFG